MNRAVLDPLEVTVLDKLCSQFADTTSWNMVEMCHRKDAWGLLYERKEIISYQEYAFDLNGA
jgi:hypothetical protein